MAANVNHGPKVSGTVYFHHCNIHVYLNNGDVYRHVRISLGTPVGGLNAKTYTCSKETAIHGRVLI